MAKVYPLPKQYSPDFSNPNKNPLGPVEIDWSNSITKGMITCRVGNRFQNELSRRRWNLSSVDGNLIVSSRGAAYNITNTAGDFTIDPLFVGDYTGTILCGVIFRDFNGTTFTGSADNSGASIYSQRVIDTDDSPTFCVTTKTFASPAGQHRLWFGWDSDGTAYGAASTSDLSTDTYYNIGCARDATGAKGLNDGHLIYLNGAEEGRSESTAGSALAGASDVNGTILGHGQWPIASVDNADIEVFYFYAWDRLLSDEEIRALNDDPYQILKPAIPIQYFISASGAFTLTADSGAYTYAGTSAELDAGLVMAAISGSYTYSGTAADLNYGFNLTASSGTYSYSGTAVELDAGFVIAANSGTYNYSGTSADLNVGYPLPANSGTYTYSGTAATLTFTGAGAFTLTADSGAYTYSGTVAELDAGFVLDASSGSYTYSGTAATLTHNYPLSADSGSYTYSGTASELDAGFVLGAASDAYTYAGTTVTLQASGQVWTVQTNNSSSWTIQSNNSTTWTVQ